MPLKDIVCWDKNRHGSNLLQFNETIVYGRQRKNVFVLCFKGMNEKPVKFG